MPVLGLIGGLSPQSTLAYYRDICAGFQTRLGGLHGPDLVMISVNQQEVTDLRESGAWDGVARMLSAAARRLEEAGAGIVLIACNSVHHVAPEIEQSLGIPFLHIADPVGQEAKKQGLTRLGLLGTRYTMEMRFYHDRLARHGITALIPEEDERADIHRIIFTELCKGQVREDSRARFLDIGAKLLARGAQGLILGCTEIDMLLHAQDFSAPVFDTTQLHIAAAVRRALEVPEEDFCLRHAG